MELTFRQVKQPQDNFDRHMTRWAPIAEAVEKLKPGYALEVDVPETRMKSDFRGTVYGALRNKGLKIRSSYSTDRRKVYLWFDGYVKDNNLSHRS